jgi:hypothetical protein
VLSPDSARQVVVEGDADQLLLVALLRAFTGELPLLGSFDRDEELLMPCPF